MSTEHTARLACIQWDVQLGDLAANIDLATRLVEEAAADGAQLVVLPEMWGTSFMAEAADSVRGRIAGADEALAQLSARLRLIAVGSNYEFADDGKVYNRARIWQDGTLLGDYRKIHLFSPLGEDRHFAGGTAPLVVDTRLGRIAVATCYDLRFPELTRFLYLEGAEVLVLPSQWPEARALHWRVLTRARAIENQMFVVATNRCGFETMAATGQEVGYPGNSVIVDPTGEIRAKGNGEEGHVMAEVDLKEAQIVRRAIPIGKDRRPDVYEDIWDKYLRSRVRAQ
ncbi:MAG: nitrilase-related carbon-nitrogen hydrolase [Planctomycetota bacterium]